MICGCIQFPAASPATPAPSGGLEVVTHTLTTVPPHRPMEVNVTARETANNVVIMVEGGKDAAFLSSLNVRITNFDGTVIQRTIANPVIGESYSIAYYRTANAATINIIGTFSDGFQQTLLLNSV
jgi:hypothetical protein